MKNNNCISIYLKKKSINKNDENLCNNCYIFINFIKCFNKDYLEIINMPKFKNIFYIKMSFQSTVALAEEVSCKKHFYVG